MCMAAGTLKCYGRARAGQSANLDSNQGANMAGDARARSASTPGLPGCVCAAQFDRINGHAADAGTNPTGADPLHGELRAEPDGRGDTAASGAGKRAGGERGDAGDGGPSDGD